MKKISTFEHVLYIYHKDFLNSSDIYVRKSKVEDMDDAKPLLEGIINKEKVIDDILEAIKYTASSKCSFSVFFN